MSEKIKFPEYDEDVNYKRLVIEYEKKYCAHDYLKYTPEQLWGDSVATNKTFYLIHNQNMKASLKLKSLTTELAAFQKINSKNNEDFPWAFVTINWDDNNVTVAQMKKASATIFGKPWVGNGSLMVLEKHRKDEGIHHHTHLLLKFTEKKNPSRVIDEIFMSAGVRAICREKNWVDYLGPQKPKKGHRPYQVYYDYVHGNKCEEKMPYVEKDRSWREENNIEHIYEKCV